MIMLLCKHNNSFNRLFIQNNMNAILGIYPYISITSNLFLQINKENIKNEIVDIIDEILDNIDYNEYFLSDSSDSIFNITLSSEDELDLDISYDDEQQIILDYSSSEDEKSLIPESSYFSNEDITNNFVVIHSTEIINDTDPDASIDSQSGIPKSAFLRLGKYLYERD